MVIGSNVSFWFGFHRQRLKLDVLQNIRLAAKIMWFVMLAHLNCIVGTTSFILLPVIVFIHKNMSGNRKLGWKMLQANVSFH